MKFGTSATFIALGAIIVLGLSATGIQMFSSEKPETFASTPTTPKTTIALQSAMTSSQTSSSNTKLLRVHASQLSHCKSGVSLDAKSLLKLPQQRFQTSHTWSDTAQEFSGPLLKDVLNLVCNDTANLVLRAINDYSTEMDFNAVKQYNPIVALSVNGERLSVRNKGPLWIMMPLDDFEEIQPSSLDDVLIWQLSDIHILSTNESI